MFRSGSTSDLMPWGAALFLAVLLIGVGRRAAANGWEAVTALSSLAWMVGYVLAAGVIGQRAATEVRD